MTGQVVRRGSLASLVSERPASSACRTFFAPGSKRAKRLRDRLGMTIIELLVVITLIGLIAAIAYNKLLAREGAYLAVMQSDLRNVITAQEAYHAEHGRYANSTPELNFNTSPKVHLLVVGDSVSWAARTQHETRNDYRCAMYMGPADPIFPPAQEEGVIECLPKRKTGQTRQGH